MRLFLLAGMTVLTLSACGGKDRGLRDFRSDGGGPDEFTVSPALPLEAPASFVELPTPTPGSSNLTDANPQAQAIAALGGNPASANRGIPVSDSALIAHTSRNGTGSDIRGVLAAEDAAFRKRRGRIGGLFGGKDKYFAAYASQALDAFAELTRWRQRGVKTPSAPPIE